MNNSAAMWQGTGNKNNEKSFIWLFDRGFQKIRFDVAASNKRAINCYENAGFKKVGEFRREAIDLKKGDLNKKKYDFLKEHVKFEDGIPLLRFYWMEIENSS